MAGRPRTVTDEAIFRAVADAVTAVGPGGLTLAAVAKRVGLSAPALNQRFGSKRGLLVAFATSEAGGIPEIFAGAREATAGPLEAVRTALISLPGPIATREGMANNLAFLQLDLTDPELRTHAVAQSRALRAELAGLLTAASAAGQLAIVDAEALAELLYAVYTGAMLTWAIDGDGELTEWLGEHVDRALTPYRRDASSS